jgi:hypothetical protein
MKRTVGTFTKEQLAEIANRPNHIVYEPTHDFHFEPWKSEQVAAVTTAIIQKTKEWEGTPDALRKELTNDTQICEFAARYKVFFDKLTTPEFVADDKHLKVLQGMLSVRANVDNGTLSEEEAKTQCADLALKSLIRRV